MALPCFKVYKVISSDKEQVFSLLKQINFSSAPIIIQIQFVEENQLIVLDYIEEYLISINKRMLPYDVYIITSVEEYTGPLSIFSEMNRLPQHYRRKNISLNTKEANIMKKIVLKQTNIQNLNEKDFKDTIQSYSQHQTELKQLSEYEHFLKQVKNKIGVELE